MLDEEEEKKQLIEEIHMLLDKIQANLDNIKDE